MRFLEPPWCDVLGTPFSYEMGEGTISAAALSDPPAFERARAAVAYDGVARRLVQALKYQDRTDLAPWLARWMIRSTQDLIQSADRIVPVPLHRVRFFTRRFNQAAELARAICRLTGAEFDPAVLERKRVTQKQVGLDRKARADNVRRAFAVPAGARSRLNGSRVLVIDDVLTTGATVNAVSHALKAGGADAVDVLTFARVLPADFALLAERSI